MNAEQTAQVLAHLGAAYRLEVEPDQLVVWTEALGRQPFAAVVEATRAWIQEQPRFPNPSQLIAATRDVLRGQAADRPRLAEQSEVPEPLPRRRQLARLGMAEMRAALAAGKAARTTDRPTTTPRSRP